MVLEEEVDLANGNIANNFKALRAIDKLEKIQLKELKKLFKQNKIQTEEYHKQKEHIQENAKVTKNGVLEELTYNTSFIVSKYDELSKLKEHEKIKSINKKHKLELKKLNKKIKEEKQESLGKINKIIRIYKENGKSKEEINVLKSLKKDKLKNIENKHSEKLNTIEENLIKSRRTTKYSTIAISVAIGIPVLMLIGLLINYFVYFPKQRGGQFSFSDTSLIAPFIISMIMIVIVLLSLVFMIRKTTKRIVIDRQQNTAKLMSIGFISSFFDILGVGSFATSLGLLKATKSFEDDKMIPGTLNMAFSVPILVEGSFLVSATKVDIITLVVLVACAVVGSYIGAMIVDKVNTQIVKVSIAVALFIAAVIMILTTAQVGVITAGLATMLRGWKLAVAIVGFLMIGVLMSFGVGSYAPAMAILGLLGMSVVAIAPIMMCSSAFLMPLTSYKFYKDNNYLPKTSLTLMLGGVLGATVSFIFFYIGIQIGVGMDPSGVAYQSMIKWLTIAVMFYSSITMLIEFFNVRKENKEKPKVKKTKRRPLDQIKNRKERRNEITNQMEFVADKYSNDELDTKQIVEDENIPIDQWVKTENVIENESNDGN